jgi:phosphate/sulfate permease/low affinity Fe/Cu permease
VDSLSKYVFLSLLSIDLWALDERGHPLPIWNDEKVINASYDSSWYHSIYKWFESFVMNSVAAKQTISRSLHQELAELYHKLEKEKFKFQFLKTENSKNKRLLLLFQMDLLPGMTGEILNSKEQRDNVMLLPVSGKIKMISWVFLAFLNLGMLFYVFLFAIRQNTHRQAAWGRSLAMYLFLDILLISSCMVIFMHILLPSIVMRDVVKIRKKLTETVSKYYQDLAAIEHEEEDKVDDLSKQQIQSPLSKSIPARKPMKTKKPKVFNTAKYLFLSYRMAECYPDLKASKIILQYQSPWPRQSYQHTIDMKKDYKYSKAAALSRSASIIVVFFLTNLLATPLAIQDMILQMAATIAMGYTILIHIQLYQIFPALVIVPTIGLAVTGYFVYNKYFKKQSEEDNNNNDEDGKGSQKKNKTPSSSRKMLSLKSVKSSSVSPMLLTPAEEKKMESYSPTTRNRKQMNSTHQPLTTRRQSLQFGMQLTSQIKDLVGANESKMSPSYLSDNNNNKNKNNRFYDEDDDEEKESNTDDDDDNYNNNVNNNDVKDEVDEAYHYYDLFGSEDRSKEEFYYQNNYYNSTNKHRQSSDHNDSLSAASQEKTNTNTSNNNHNRKKKKNKRPSYENVFETDYSLDESFLHSDDFVISEGDEEEEEEEEEEERSV